MAWRTINFSANGGTLKSQTPLYYATNGRLWYTAKTETAQYNIAAITPPVRSGYVFTGFWTSSSGTGTQIVGKAGMLYAWQSSPTDNQTIYAGWLPYAKITLDKGNGTGGTSAFYYKINGGGFYSDTGLTAAITSIAPPTGGGTFKGYRLNGVTYIDEHGEFTSALLNATITQDCTLTASWFGGVIDYFNLGSSTLVPFESDPGDNRRHIVTRHYGKFKKTGTGAYEGAEAISGAWRNPTVKYMVVGDMTLVVTLGKAFAATSNATGYMITSAIAETYIRRVPVVTVQGTANEGADAINLFQVSIPILARARPQNLLGAIAVSGGKTTGGELHACSIQASCDPVVLAENMTPCASDVVGGRLELHAETLAAASESAPTMATSGGFTLIAAPPADEGANYRRYRVTARKEIY